MTERLYFTDSFLTNFDAIVTEIQEVSRSNGQSLWRVALNRSAFYPTSGGQPYDTGQLIATARSGAELAADIVEVEEDEHGEVWHHTAKPLSAGTPVRGRIDATRRLDHIQQHSGQHLLSAAFFQVCGAATVSFHLGTATSTIDLAAETLPDSTLQQVEQLANQVIAENRLVTMSVVSKSQAESWLASGEIRKLPPREGELRIVEIAGKENVGASIPLDRNACGGTHVRMTGQIGGLHLRGIEKVRQGWRVQFVCGLRAMRTARADFIALTDAAGKLSVSTTDFPEVIERMQAEIKRTAKLIQKQISELAAFRATELIQQTPIEHGMRTIRLNLTTADADDASYAKLLAGKLTVTSEKTVAVLSWCPAEENTPTTIFLARSRDLNFDCGALLRHALEPMEGRGGGSKDMAQGSVAEESLQSALDSLDRSIAASNS